MTERILVVDDDEDIVRVVRINLELEGFLVETAGDGQEALDKECVDHVKAVTKEAEKNGILGHGLHHPFKTMFEDVFEELPWHLKEQSEQAIHERETKFPEGRPNS